LRAERCISYLTLEHRGEIPSDLQPLMGDWIGGCDVCQEVCPYNAPDRLARLAPMEHHPDYKPRSAIAPGVDLLSLLGWTEADRHRAFMGSALKRIKPAMLRRNAVIAAGNTLAQQPDLDEPTREGLRRGIEAYLDDPEPMVRLAAERALQPPSDAQRPAGPDT
jgi:epoxyqueuosine reductase